MARNAVVIVVALYCWFGYMGTAFGVCSEYQYRECVRQIIEQAVQGRVLTCEEYKLGVPERDVQREGRWNRVFEYPRGRLYSKPGVKLGVYRGRLISIFCAGDALKPEITREQITEEMREDHRATKQEVDNRKNMLCYALPERYLRFYFDSDTEDGVLVSYSIKSR